MPNKQCIKSWEMPPENVNTAALPVIPGPRRQESCRSWNSSRIWITYFFLPKLQRSCKIYFLSLDKSFIKTFRSMYCLHHYCSSYNFFSEFLPSFSSLRFLRCAQMFMMFGSRYYQSIKLDQYIFSF